MNITIIHPRMHAIGGAERLVTDLAVELSLRGHTIRFITGKYHSYWRSLLTRNDRISVKELGIRADNLFFWLLIKEFCHKLTNLIDASSQLLIASGFPSTISAAITPCKNAVKLAYLHDAPPSIHDVEAWRKLPTYLRTFYKLMAKRYREIDKSSLLSSDIIATNSKRAARINANVYGIDPSQIRTIYPGVNAREFDGQNNSVYPRKNSRLGNLFTKITGKFKGPVDILFIPKGASLWRKPETVLKAATILRNTLLVFTGGTLMERRMVMRMAKRLGISGRIFCLPELLGDELKFMYSICSLVISISYRESFGLTPLEALLIGKPAIISCTSGVSEVLEHGRHTLYVKPDDYVSLAHQVEKLLTDESLSEKLVQNGRSRVLEMFTTDHFVNTLLKEVAIS
jgi:glycosyltransferase involved in cell wall biosynthesis